MFPVAMICAWTTKRSTACPLGVLVWRLSAVEVWCVNDSSGLADTHALAGFVQSADELQERICPAWSARHTRAARLMLVLVRIASSWLNPEVSAPGSPGVCLP